MGMLLLGFDDQSMPASTMSCLQGNSKYQTTTIQPKRFFVKMRQSSSNHIASKVGTNIRGGGAQNRRIKGEVEGGIEL
jgi:hypothetical protein